MMLQVPLPRILQVCADRDFLRTDVISEANSKESERSIAVGG